MPKVVSEYDLHLVNGLAPVADAFSGTVYTDIVKLTNTGFVTFVIYKGAEVTGTTTVTVQPCSNAAAGVQVPRVYIGRHVGRDYGSGSRRVYYHCWCGSDVCHRG